VTKRLRDARKSSQEALDADLLSAAEMEKLSAMQALVDKVVAVDEYTPEELSRYFKDHSAQAAEDYEATPKEAAE